MSPEQQKYVIDNKLQKKEILLLKKFRYINVIITIVLCTILGLYFSVFFLAIMFILVFYDILISPKTLIVIDGEKIHEVTNFRAKVYSRNDYKTILKYLYNKRNKAMYFTYAITKEQVNRIKK